MGITVRELIAALKEIDQDWRVYATRAGGSISVWDDKGPRYGYVFTDGRPTRMYVDRRWQPQSTTQEAK